MNIFKYLLITTLFIFSSNISGQSSSDFKVTKGYISGLMQNLDISKDKAIEVNELQKKFKKQLSQLPGKAGNKNKESVKSLMQKKNQTYKDLLGAKYPTFIKYERWYNKNLKKKNDAEIKLRLSAKKQNKIK